MGGQTDEWMRRYMEGWIDIGTNDGYMDDRQVVDRWTYRCVNGWMSR